MATPGCFLTRSTTPVPCSPADARELLAHQPFKTLPSAHESCNSRTLSRHTLRTCPAGMTA